MMAYYAQLMASKQFVTFYLGDDLFGIDILVVREINRNLDITPIDRAPDFVRGLLNLRGQIVTVLDLGNRLGLNRRTVQKTSSCIVLKTTQELERNGVEVELATATTTDVVGLFVDRIGDVVTVDTSEIAPPANHQSGLARRYMHGVIKLQGQLLVTLKTSAILSAEEELARV